MQKINENSSIYLSGGGNEKQSFPLDKYFFDRISQGGRFLYVPIALRGHKLYPTAHLWMKGITTLHEREDTLFDTVDNPAEYHFNDVKKYSGVYIGGGNTWSLIQELTEAGWDDILPRYLDTGGQVYGGSAGAIIMGKKINTHDDENIIGRQNQSGFALLGKYSVSCHYRDEQSERFQSWAIDNTSPIICLSEETGLVIEKGAALCVGTKPCVVYFADGSEKVVSQGDSVHL